MAEFCKKHALEMVGKKEEYPEYTQTEYDLLLAAWTTDDLCEECGYDYLREKSE